MAQKGVSVATQRSGRSGVRHIPILETREFPGLYSYPKPQQIPRGAAQTALNFLTKRTWIETRGGYHPLGNEVSGVNGKVLGIFTAHKWDGTEIIFKATLDGKLKWYDPLNTSAQGAADQWSEVGGVGGNILAGAVALGESVYMDEYISPAGAQLWVSSPSSDLIKIMTANPLSFLTQYSSSKNFKGRLRIINNSMFMWYYFSGLGSIPTKNTLQRSYVDTQAYQTKSDANGALSIVVAGGTITGTLTKNAIANATVFGISIVDTDTPNETFLDDHLGNLTGSAGGTGTIDYSTGKFTLKPKVAPVSPSIAATYSYEDSTAGGIADFTKSGTRLAGQGVAWVQNSGGDILGVNPYNGSYYIPHQRKAWIITPSADDSSATNLIYRENMYMPSERGSVATADGIYYVDITNAARPFIGLLTLDTLTSLVLPQDLSSTILDLTGYTFDQCFAYQALDWIFFWCRTTDSSFNNRVIAYNFKLSDRTTIRGDGARVKVFDILDYFATCGTTYGGQIIAGDPISNNAYKLFDGYDDDGGIPNMFWFGNQDDHGIAGLKQCKKLWQEGYIGVNQSVDVYIQLDANMAIKVGTISGSGKYVDTSNAVTVGSVQVGVFPIPGPSSVPVGYHYLMQITINSAKYKYFTIGYKPTSIGYFSVQMYANYDIRINVDKLPRKYRDIFNQATISGGGGSTPIPPTPPTPSVIKTETPQGLIDGSNKVYSVGFIVSSVLNFEINGMEINSGMYTISGKNILFKQPLDASLAGTPFEIVYIGS